MSSFDKFALSIKGWRQCAHTQRFGDCTSEHGYLTAMFADNCELKISLADFWWKISVIFHIPCFAIFGSWTGRERLFHFTCGFISYWAVSNNLTSREFFLTSLLNSLLKLWLINGTLKMHEESELSFKRSESSLSRSLGVLLDLSPRTPIWLEFFDHEQRCFHFQRDF